MRARESRLDIRIKEDTKKTIEDAASFLGVTTTAFVIECVMRRATKVLEEAQHIRLNAEESRRFIDMLENPPEPNENLKRLFKRHQQSDKKK